MKKCHADVVDIVEHSIKEIAADSKSKDLVKARTALILCLVRGLVSQVSSMERTQRSMEKRQKYIQLRLEGELEKNYPWDRLAVPRRNQVIAVREAMRKDSSLNIPTAAASVFRRIPGGYPDAENLAAYCYSIGIVNYLAD